ncbi:DUF3592 domain-containing protein [Streptomyces camelliae]|uniref:DUF3592 domain-containing protein n=1 Tax=Streptomyces camelliae TaxID=3004093 RepID=A0ABY7PH94_9ACTN|nr:DUF3592 domain-containing protein [Streptomyces sp. HUAS 2-6]WBO68989.1 hypothetical protein O1G22_42595 [Streptomyces sp. HUAS 2-6]
MIFVVAAMLMATFAGRLALVAVRTVRLHRHGVRTAGSVISIWEDTDRDGPPQMLAQIGFDLPDGRRGGWIHIPARRRGGALHVGDRLPMLYDSQQPSRAHVLPDGSPRLLVTAGVMATLALSAVGFACFLLGLASVSS